jgi:hypothetical protein
MAARRAALPLRIPHRLCGAVRRGRIVPLRGTITRSVMTTFKMTTFKTLKHRLVVLHFLRLSF